MNIQVISATLDVSDVMSFIHSIQQVKTECCATIQALDADFVAGTKHIIFATEKAIRSWESGKPIANDLGMEILLYASGKRQINKALDMGMHVGDNRIAFIIVSDNPSVTKEAVHQLVALVKEMGGSVAEDTDERAHNDIFEYSKDKKERLQLFFDITDLELEAAGAEKICDLVLERVAMVDVLK